MFSSLIVPSIAPCRVASFLEDLDAESRKNLEFALALPRDQVAHAKIARQIAGEANVRIDPETIAAHRNGVCRCSKN